MITLKKLTEMLSCLDVGYCYGPFPDNQEVPYISYKATESHPISADGIILYEEESVELILVTKKRDATLEKKIDRLFRCSQTVYSKETDFDAEQKIHITTYRFTAESEG